MERLDKFLVAGGVGSRSQVKDILKKGTVTVDGVPERDGARKIDPDKLRPITFDPIHNAYRVLGEKVGNAFKDGAKLK